MQPYQEAADQRKRQSELPMKIAKGAASVGVSALGAKAAAGIGSKILPFLSKYIPQELAIKGMSKIDPRMGKFIQKSMSEGYDYDEVKEFIGEKFEQPQSEPAKQEKNIIEQYSPDLHQFLLGEMQSGRSPLEAGALASLDRKGKNFKKIIEKMVADHKTPWTAILQTVYGDAQGQQPSQQKQQPQSQQQTGQGQSALMAILQKLQAARGAQ